MASDVARKDPARACGEQRGITLRERVTEIVRDAPEKARSIFAGFKPAIQKDSIAMPEPSRTKDTQRAVERYARARADIDRTRERQLPVPAHQTPAQDERKGGG